MTLQEFQQRIAVSPNKDWYQNYKLQIHYAYVNYATEFVGVVNIYDFVSKQSDGFSSLANLPQELDRIREFFIDAKAKILNLVSNENISESQWNNSLNTIAGKNAYQKMLLFDMPETIFLLKISKERPNAYAGAFEFITSDHVAQTETKAYLEGYLLAYEFASRDFSQLAERAEAEKKSILSIRNEFDKALQKAEIDVVEYFDRTNQKFKDYADQIDILKTEKKVVFDNWFQDVSKKFTEFDTNSNKKIIELEELYKAKLKLEAPAKYWNDRAKILRASGNKWLIALLVSVAVGIGLLTTVLILISTGELEKVFQKTATAIKWSIVFVTLVSFIAFVIRIFSKLTFSSYHLVRDAEEREQLTYVYLALQKEKGIDQTERHLIMQSIFSRADSGLLKDDSAPTMPGNIIDQVIKK